MFDEVVIDKKHIYIPYMGLSSDNVNDFIELIEIKDSVIRNNLYVFNCSEQELANIINEINEKQALGENSKTIYHKIIENMKLCKWKDWKFSKTIDEKEYMGDKLCPFLVYYK